ncbi:MAG TPA: hypothetical protein VMW10_12900 [Alphaproteobacteria bacterium]|nr:hypothetical protein [Alphaproteobacteria bacterium]
MFKKNAFYQIVTFAYLLFLTAYNSVQAMQGDDSDDGKGVRKVLSEKKKKQLASSAFDKAMEKLVQKEYDGAFRRFVYVAFQDVFHVSNFKKAHGDIKDYHSALLSGFGYHPTPPSEDVQRRHAAFGYVFTLWKSNGEGLHQECTIGKAMEKCVKEFDNVRLIDFKCSPETRATLLEDSKGWKLEEDLFN